MDFEESWTNPNPNSTPNLPLLAMAPMIESSPERSGMQTPPLHTSASIPFQWEEQPGKPRPCTSLIPYFTNDAKNIEPRSLELPPRLLIQETHKINTKNSSPSPVTVLGGPYVSRSSRFISSSFRLFRERQGSFDSNSIGSKSPDEELGDFGNGVFWGDQKLEEERRGFLGSWKRKMKSKVMKKVGGGGREEIGSSSFVYRSSMDTSSFWNYDVGGHKSNRVSNVKKHESFGSFSQAKSHFWAAVYEGIKQVIPWKSKKS